MPDNLRGSEYGYLKRAGIGRRELRRGHNTTDATPQQQRKVHKVMSEFKEGTLRSSSGEKVAKRDQAVAIAMSEAGLSRDRGKS